MGGCDFFLPVSVFVLVILAFLLELIALTTTWWASYNSITDLGKPKESGHYGLWTICSNKGPHWIEDCDPLDTFFQLPSYASISGIMGIIHLILLLGLLPLGAIRAVQVVRNVPDCCLPPKILCISKVSLAFISMVFAILAAIFISIGENKSSEYMVWKAWSFWIQISVITADFVITMICVMENFRYWQQHLRSLTDPSGEMAETYGNPSFDTGSPNLSKGRSTASRVSYTEASGEPCVRNERQVLSTDSSQSRRNGKKSSWTHKPTFNYPCVGAHKEKIGRHSTSPETVTYENPTFQHQSPRSDRRTRYSNKNPQKSLRNGNTYE